MSYLNFNNFFALILVVAGLFSCSNTKTDTDDDILNQDYHLLFIGNSLTYSNNLPKLVEKEANRKGIKIETEMIAYGNYAIIDHWDDGDAQVLIATKKYDYVIVQQGPSSQDFGREVLIEYGEKFSTLCKENNCKLCYFMVWPSLTYYHTFDGVIKNHQDAARMNDAILLPVGEVWKEHFDATENFDYYSSDGFHPSLKGSKVAAAVIVEYLFEK